MLCTRCKKIPATGALNEDVLCTGCFEDAVHEARAEQRESAASGLDRDDYGSDDDYRDAFND